jgi:hypothetical protein
MTKIYINTHISDVNNWLLEKLKKYLHNLDIQELNNHIFNGEDIIIVDDEKLDAKLYANKCNLIVITKNTFFSEYNNIECSVIYAPISIAKLVSLINNQINQNNNMLTFDNFIFEFNLNSGSVKFENITIEFTQNESIILKLLIQNYKQNTKATTLLNAIGYSDATPDSSTTIQTHISTIKTKFKEHNINLLITKNKDTYCLTNK